MRKGFLVGLALLAGAFLGYRSVLPVYALSDTEGFSSLSLKAPVKVEPVHDEEVADELRAAMLADSIKLFDGRTDSGYLPSEPVKITLENNSEIHAIKVFGGSSFNMSVFADNDGDRESIEGLTGLDLHGLSEHWHTFRLKSPVNTSALYFEFKSREAEAPKSIREIEIWALGEHAPLHSNDDLVKQIKIEKPVPQSRVYSVDGEAVIGPLQAGEDGSPVDNPDDNTFSINIDYYPTSIKRAILVYEVHGLSHWATVKRSINGKNTKGGFLLPHANEWSQQVEEIDPVWLLNGENTVEFSVPDNQRYFYSVKGVHFVVELLDGHNFIIPVTVSESGDEIPHPAFDGDQESSWKIRNSDGHEDSESQIEVVFDYPIALDALNIYFNKSYKGKIELLRQHENEKWESFISLGSETEEVQYKGWNRFDIESEEVVEAIRIRFEGDDDSTIEIGEIQFSGSVVGDSLSRLKIGYPDNGQYFGRSAYIRGFITPFENSSGKAEVKVGGKKVVSEDGSFEVVISKDAVGFSEQGDSESWWVDVVARYPDGKEVKERIKLDQHYEEVIWSDQDGSPTHTETMDPDEAGETEFDGARLEIEAGALSEKTAISITSLSEKDLPKLDPGMTNVTKGPRRGYRFTPHGIKFNKNIKVSMQVDPAMIPAGMSIDDVRTFYFDEEVGRWVPLEKVTFKATTNEIESHTDHFTSMIAATLRVPDHPTPMSFNPNSMKDIKAADPGAGINLIEIPQSNNMGDARLTYPIEVPAGRNGMQPQLAVQYNSSGSNGWMGLGWDIAMQSITIDTRWGVPRYSAAKETETYLLNGEMLTPVAHRSEPIARSGEEKVFHTRVEGQFRKIIRHGTSPSTYWWEVIDKSGTHFYYGASANANGPEDNSTLKAAGGNVFKWALREVRDSNGNSMSYICEHVADVGVAGGSVQGDQLYLKKINYSGYRGSDGYYSIEFKRDRNLPNFNRRTDVSIDGRGGFKMVTADLLKEIVIKEGFAVVRTYKFDYQIGAFEKTLLKSASQYGADGGFFHTHAFDYFDEIRDGNNYAGFGSAQSWNTGQDNVSLNLFAGNGDASAFSGSAGDSSGGHLYIGFGLIPGKNASGGFKVGYSSGSSDGVLAMADLNGDGLPDKVYKSGGYSYRPNQSGPDGTTVFGAPVALPTLPGISSDSSNTTTVGGELFFYASVLYDVSDTFSTTSAYFSDVNGDGLTDFVSGGAVWFNHLDEQGVPTFNPNSALSPVTLGDSLIDTNALLADYGELFEKRIDTFPLMDSVRRWEAPYDGTVRINGNVNLIEDNSEARSNYTTADGIRVAVQKNGAELWSDRIQADDYDVHATTGLDAIQVNAGDRIYFRVQSVFDGAYDQVAWNPEITYLNIDAGLMDVNQLTPYAYSASDDFIMIGRSTPAFMPYDGQIHLFGDLTKSGATTDDIALVVRKNGNDVLRRQLSWNQSGTISLNDDLTVNSRDTIEFFVEVDSVIDMKQISWQPQLYYSSASTVVDGVSQDVEVVDENGEYMIRMSPSYGADIYPANHLAAPQQAWQAGRDGRVVLRPKLTFKNLNSSYSSEYVFTVKQQGKLIAKQKATITDGVIQRPSIQLDVKAGDRFVVDLVSRDANLFDLLKNLAVIANYDDNPDTDVSVIWAWHDVGGQSAFSRSYRGWSVAGYNGNRDRADQPIDETLLVLPPIPDGFTPGPDNPVPPGYDPANIYVYMFAPFPDKNHWRGQDADSWISADGMSASRLGLDYIQVPTVDQFAGARAISRLGEASQQAFGAGLLGASASHSEGSNSGLLEYMDMNGDRFPDILSVGGVQYTTALGSLEAGRLGIPGFSIRGGDNTADNLGIGGAVARATIGGSGESKGVTSDMSAMLSGGRSNGGSETGYDLMDINGDGLPDRVSASGGQLRVALNLGYSFGAFELWGTARINAGESKSSNFGLGFDTGNFEFAGGLSRSRGENWTNGMLTDVNGDGLPDYVVPNGSSFSVSLNRGNGFTAPVTWSGTVNPYISHSANGSEGGGVYYTYSFPLCIFSCYFVVNPGVNFGKNMMRQEVSLRDVNGDGYPDHLFSNNDASMQVALNRTGRTNLLKRVTRPLGAVIDIDYKRSGNTYEQPQSRWVMSSVTVSDALEGDGVDTQLITYDYEDGYYDRLERDFYGYKTVTEHQHDASGGVDGAPVYREVVRTFANDHYYVKGLMLSTLMRDADQRPYTETINSYALWEVDDQTPFDSTDLANRGKMLIATVFPQLEKVERRFYEGQSQPGKRTFVTYDYDEYGNVSAYFDVGDPQLPEDDVRARIEYQYDIFTHIVDKPRLILVTDSSGREMRRREGRYQAGTGNLIAQYEFLLDGTVAETSLVYTLEGNLQMVMGPANHRGQRYQINYEYDPVVRTHITAVSDSFGYRSAAEYDLRFGKPTLNRDTNAQETRYTYDQFGRTKRIIGPYQTLGGR